ncbi:C1 family peptidase [Tetragenococcus halophilus]|uniref:aminopeptidase C n=1 Tax=Tetragenococcus halophilus TaxID=51669 RepID=UPI000CB08CB5|nr:C1 family peptidase [Tetragenococcus halophilus]RQD29103.1 aminopeptidase [Tetragenococcus halophilus subsp. halophilus DSM 20339]GBD59187.1 aminopeptidase PepC [Tetragenococcus halophilus subsp. halophilus]GBD73694.1 aminopeptidase PepC [Tetragenococcus halophilus subsp. halophilus]GBD76245.1 aminopeptidase PepC [Tetragenococcus halophilus subsp. halophilus]GMA42592.1 aminopeptidase C [Tetragenococcus halophilus subsp. halophilus DSM 20339]
MAEITNELTAKFAAEFKENDKQQVAQNAVVKNGITNSAENIVAQSNNVPVFSIDLKTGNVSNQKQSGRCWMFAALNTFRHKILDNFDLKDFELSQNYTNFWDKYEKSNYFYENILATADQEVTSRRVAFLLETPQQDGGQWDMMVSLFNKYGVVPKAAMPESSNSSNSRDLNNYLNKKLRKDAATLRQLVADGASANDIQASREDMLQEVYNILAISLGTPPTTFAFEYRDENKEYHIDRDLTPKSFYDKYVGVDLNNYVPIINAPTDDKPYNQSYTVEMLGNVVGGKQVKYLNLDMDTFKKLAIAQLEQGESVWFGCDVGQSSNRQNGIMSLDTYDMNELFDVDFTTTKAQRLDYGESLMTHAMVLTGVDIVDDKSTKWKVENSWGDKVGDKGFFVASDAWMDEYTYQIVVRKDLLTAEQLKAYEKEPTVLAPWDPMGALA